MKKIRYAIYSVLPLLVLILIAESALRLAGFKYSDTPLEIQNLPQSLAEDVAVKHTDKLPKWSWTMKKDPRQIWVPEKGSFEEKYAVQKPQGVIRLATMGCSCTWGCFGTEDSYPALLEKLLNEPAPHKYEVLNAGVPGYSSYQGRQRLQHAVLRYNPDIVTIFFGWNDHWVARIPDKEIRPRSDLTVILLNFFEHFRTYQALHKLIAVMKPAPEATLKGPGQLPLRVSFADYEQNLTEMIRVAQSAGIRPVLITAPADPSQLDSSWVFPFPRELLPQIHAGYNQIVRKVASDKNIPLIDLSAEMEALQKTAPENTPKLFSDGVHFSPFGCEIVAKILLVELRRLKLI